MEDKEIVEPSAELLARIQGAIGIKPIRWASISKGYTTAERYVITLEDGSSIFAKVATDEDTAQWLRNEYRVYGALRADFLPELLAWEDTELPLLILEDLSKGFWPPPWSQERITNVFETLKNIAAIEPPPETPSVRRLFKDFSGWEEIKRDPSGFLGLGLVSPRWLDAALPALVRAEQGANLEGNALLHMDVRSDNICFAGGRTLLVDWNWASVGPSQFDLIAWLPSLHSEGGPAPWEITLDEPELIVLTAGYFASRAYKPPLKEGSTIRQLQLTQLKSALPWAARALKLPMPESVA